MAELTAPVVDPVKPQVPELNQEEVVKLRAEVESLKDKAAKTEKLQQDLDGAVAELIELRKKKSISPEEKEKLEKEVANLKSKLEVATKQRNEQVLNRMASTPSADPNPAATETNQLSTEQEKLRKDKGWTAEKYLSMKAKYPDIVP